MPAPTAAIPDDNITLGYEVEFDTTRMPPETYLAIKITNKSGSSRYVTPDEYLNNFDLFPDDLSCMYDVQLVVCHQLDTHGQKKNEIPFIDAAFDSAVSSSTGKKQYLPEFRTEPFSTTSLDGLKNVSDFFKIIEHHIHYINTAKVKPIEIKNWVEALKLHAATNASWLSTRYAFNADILEPKASYKASTVLSVPHPELFNPILAIHVNIAVPLRALYSTYILDAFPHEENYPPKIAATPEWPSCHVPPEHAAFAKKLITSIEHSVAVYLKTTLSKDTNLRQSQNIAGVLRTLIFCYCMQTYIVSDLCKKHFSESIYTYDQSKDFYLFGLPKFNLGGLVDKLTPEEKSLFYTSCFPKISCHPLLFHAASHNTSAIRLLFINALSNVDTKRPPIPHFYDFKTDKLVSYPIVEFIHAVLLEPLLKKPRNNLSLVVKVLEPLVVEFRAAKGHGCTIAQLPDVLTRHFHAARTLDIIETEPDLKIAKENPPALVPPKKYVAKKGLKVFVHKENTTSPAIKTDAKTTSVPSTAHICGHKRKRSHRNDQTRPRKIRHLKNRDSKYLDDARLLLSISEVSIFSSASARSPFRAEQKRQINLLFSMNLDK